jgi:hypothetical protein
MTSHRSGPAALSIFGLLLAVLSTAHAQAPATRAAPRITLWMGGGYGRGAAEQFAGAEESFVVNLSAQRGHLLLSSRVAAVSSSIYDTTWDLGLLSGLAFSGGAPDSRGRRAGPGLCRTNSR